MILNPLSEGDDTDVRTEQSSPYQPDRVSSKHQAFVQISPSLSALQVAIIGTCSSQSFVLVLGTNLFCNC